MKIRIKFTKQGPVRFIGHLDVMRYFQKVMRRADVNIRYSEGFSPHQIMSFASPLSVGLTSNGEYMDIEVHSTRDSKTMVEEINAVSCEGIQVASYRLLDDSAKNAMSQVAAADYTMWFKEGYVPEDERGFYERFLVFCERESIEITRQTKKGEKIVDLKPYLYEIRVEERTADGGCDGAAQTAGRSDAAAETQETEEAAGSLQVFMKLSAGSAANVKPEQLMGAFYASEGLEYPVFAFQVQREEVYAEEGTEKNHSFKSLNDYGTEIL